MKKQYSLYHLITTAVFVGILLSVTIFLMVTVYVGRDEAISDTCLDGTTIEGNSFLDRFERSVYQNDTMLSLIRDYQYRLFGIVAEDDVIAGKNDFLFETNDPEFDYNYLDDYLGKLSFTQEESAQILANLQQRKDAYANEGVEFLLVILPNSQTVYSENMPDYMGDIQTTRLDRLEEYLWANGFTDFVDLTDSLISYKDQGPLYNNTENSLNALGLYYTYLSVCERFRPTVMAKTRIISRGELSFFQHTTTGKTAARRAGLSDVAMNLTVSLSNNTKLNYRAVQHKHITKTTLLPFESLDINYTPSLLLQFSNTWERLQLEPFFSNTFKSVTYQTDLSDDAQTFDLAQPRAVIQFIYENELSLLCDSY